jgi:hypothetical protein
MKIKEFQHKPVQPDTYEASMALNQLMRIAKCGMKLHNMIDNDAEMESWVAKKIDLAGDYVKKVYNYTEAEKAGLYDDGGMSEIKKMPKGTGTMQGVKEDADFNNFEKNDEYADNVETYGDVDKTPLTPQERQQFANWVKQTADYYAEKGMEGVADIGDDPDMIDGDKNLIPQIKAYLKKSYETKDIKGFADDVSNVEKKFGDEDLLMNDTGYQEADDFSEHATNYLSGYELLSSKGTDYTVRTIRGVLDHIDDDPHIASAMLLFQQEFEGTPLQKKVSRKQATESVSEDAGEKIANMAQNMTKDEFMSNADELGLTPKEAAEYYEKMQGGAYAGKFEDAGDQEKMQGLLQWFQNKYDTYRKDFIDDQIENGIRGSQLEQAVENNDELVELENIIDALKSGSMKNAIEEINRAKYEFSGIPGDGDDFMQVIEKLGIPKDTFYFTKDESLEARLEAKLREDAGEDEKIVDMLRNIKQHLDNHPNMSEHPSLVALDQLADDLESGDKPADYESVKEDAGEGHMSKSTLYHTVKYAIQLMQMIKKGDDLEGWVQSKLNKAADYLQGAANYEEYQKSNPYREELDPTLMQKHAVVIQKNIDEILDKETKLDDIDTKPGMMRILAKRVNEVEKEIAKENRKNTDEAHGGQHTTSGRSMTKGEMNKREKIVKGMKKDKAGFKKRYGKDADAVMYATATKQAMEDGHTDVPSAIRNCTTIIEDAIQMKQKLQTMEGELPSWMTQMIAVAASDLNDARDYLLNPTTEDAEDLEEGLKDWAKGLAMAGVLVAGMAGVGSIQDAIDRSVPAVQAMETALEMAKDAGNDELAAMIEKDLSAVKMRLSSGKDLGFVKGMQDKYGKFVKTKGLSYENTLRVNLESKIRSLK